MGRPAKGASPQTLVKARKAAATKALCRKLASELEDEAEALKRAAATLRRKL